MGDRRRAADAQRLQADADAGTGRITGAVLPAMFRLDAQGRPQRDADYLEKAEVIETEPKQVVLYKLNQQAVRSDGREIGAPTSPPSGVPCPARTPRTGRPSNAGYDRIEKIERGADDLEVAGSRSPSRTRTGAPCSRRCTPSDVMGTPDNFNEGARRKLKVTQGPFAIDSRSTAATSRCTLERNPRWWGLPRQVSTSSS
ncbi:hypothetical protein [Streptomyces sp. KL116D]|uniref:hypothetical protein n=1 Tax=Streptomyces sp. KL116D TaxID=3045152 RepID=UPI003558A603